MTVMLYGTINSVVSSKPGGGVMAVVNGLLGFEPRSWMDRKFQKTPIELLTSLTGGKHLQSFQRVTVVWASERGGDGRPISMSIDPSILEHKMSILAQTYDDLHILNCALRIENGLRLVDK